MSALARGYSFVMYLADAGMTYSIPFPLLHADDLRVWAGDLDDAVEQAFTWIGPTSIRLNASVPKGMLLTLRRMTRRDVPLVIAQDGAALPARDLNTNAQQLLYIVQELIDFGTNGKGLPGGGAGWPGQGDNGSEAIQRIIDQLMQSPVFQLLLQRVEPIDNLAETMLQEILRSEQQFEYRHANEARVALVETHITTLTDSAASFAEKITDVYAKFDATEAQIRQVDQARASDTAASAVRFEGVNARIGSAEANITDTRQSVATLTDSTAARFEHVDATFGTTAARITNVEQSVATETSARATAITQVNASITAANARITTVNQAVVDETSARTTAIQKSYADFNAADGAVTSAINQTLSTNYATKNYAQSVAQTQVEAWANGNFAILQQRFEALVNGNADPGSSGEWQANYTLRLNGGKIDGTPVIAGIGLGIDAKTGSNFIVMADRFAIVSPTYTSNGGVAQVKYPFVVGTVGGVSTVGITGQLIVDGSVTADKIRATTLSAITANLGEVNGGTFRTYQLDANGAVINPLEFRAELTNQPGDSYPVWVGAGVKNWNNAVFAVDRSGNAKFGGTITAQNMLGTLQASALWSWTGDLNAGGGVTSTFTLDAPVRLGEIHRPVLMVELTFYNSGGDPCNGTVNVERLDGSVWTVTRSNNYYLRSGDNIVSTIMLIDDTTSAARQYRIRTSTGGNRDGNFHLSRVTGYAFGLR